MKRRIAYVLNRFLIISTVLIAIAYALYTHEMKALRDAASITVVAVPIGLFVWSVYTLAGSSSQQDKAKR